MKNVKRVISLTLLFVFALAAMAFAYIGNARSGIFHYDGCQYVYSSLQLFEQINIA